MVVFYCSRRRRDRAHLLSAPPGLAWAGASGPVGQDCPRWIPSIVRQPLMEHGAVRSRARATGATPRWSRGLTLAQAKKEPPTTDESGQERRFQRPLSGRYH
jgi:hypothetical protein